MSATKTYPLRLPQSLKETVERLSREDGTSINQFVATAVAEKISALETNGDYRLLQAWTQSTLFKVP